MPRLTYDRFLRYDELTAFLHALVEERPQLVAVESVGRSWEGREIWLVTLTNQATGPALEKPGFLVEGNVHSNEWTGGMAALHLVDRLAHAYGADERVTTALDTRSVYVVPRLNPDGVEHTLREGRYIRSSVRPTSPRGPGLHEGDIDGDGRQLFMRIQDPDGAFALHPEEPRLLVPREPHEQGGVYYRLLPEGELVDFDGVTIRVAPSVEGLDLGANFPGDLSGETADRRTGPFTVSEPEIAAYLQAVVARPNITGYVTCHNFGGILLRGPHNDDDDMPPADERVYEQIAARGTALTGYPALTWLQLKTDQRWRVRGSQSQWFYDSLGVFSWITEFWSPWAAAGVDLGEGVASRWLGGDHPVEDDLALIRWSDEQLAGKGFVDWYPFDHPQLGPVELGGWDKINYWYNAPLELVEREVAPHTEWVLLQVLASPLLDVRVLAVDEVAGDVPGDLPGGLSRVVAVVQNTGWLPTNVTRKALDREVVGPVEVSLELPAGATLVSGRPVVELGQLAGRDDQRASSTWWSYRPDSTDRARVEWLVAGWSGGEARVVARHPRAGTARATVLRAMP